MNAILAAATPAHTAARAIRPKWVNIPFRRLGIRSPPASSLDTGSAPHSGHLVKPAMAYPHVSQHSRLLRNRRSRLLAHSLHKSATQTTMGTTASTEALARRKIASESTDFAAERNTAPHAIRTKLGSAAKSTTRRTSSTLARRPPDAERRAWEASLETAPTTRLSLSGCP